MVTFCAGRTERVNARAVREGGGQGAEQVDRTRPEEIGNEDID